MGRTPAGQTREKVFRFVRDRLAGGRPPTVREVMEAFGFRSLLAVPMIREGRLVGVFSLHRFGVSSFTEKQIELVTGFADQAVIALENVRLFNELEARNRDLAETLEQQTARPTSSA